jgi:nitrate/TMAO reductase-like tetraheme cytochrome c subunit
MSADTPPLQQTDPAGDPPGEKGVPAPRRRSRLRAAMGAVGTALLIVLIVGGIGLAGAEYHTARPTFCGSCHIMEPYYASWSHDLHGAKLGVRCVDCHYAPGERFTIQAKFKGLSQVASYFSGRYGAGRPRAHVSDSSCLTSSCHGDGAYESKRLPIGEPRTETRLVDGRAVEVTRQPTVAFYHEKHLDVEARLADAQREREALRARLEVALGAEGFQRVQRIARSVGPAEQRDEELRAALSDLGAAENVRTDAQTLRGLEHRHTRLKQLAGLTCSACHQYDATGQRHLSVTVQNCYTCHFAHESFNRGTAECLKCHEPPARVVFVHGTEAPASGPVLMDHRDIVARGIDCASCHLDVVRGSASVSERECRHCHDQDRFLVDFATRTTETVEEYHALHVAQQRARCEDCHHAVVHALLDPLRETPTGFLEPILNDCQHCHPGHHREQVEMLAGVGGVGVPRDTPNAMLGSRLNCRACHVEAGEGAKGDAVVRATQQACVACHSDDYARLFEQWRSEVSVLLEETQARLARLERAAAARPALPEDLRERIEAARRNVRFVAVAGGMHNKHFALQLLDAARRELEQAERQLSAPGGRSPPENAE